MEAFSQCHVRSRTRVLMPDTFLHIEGSLRKVNVHAKATVVSVRG